MSLRELLQHLPQEDQNYITQRVQSCHRALIRDGGNDNRNDHTAITHRYLRERIIISGVVASGHRDYYVITFNNTGRQIIRVRHRC